MDSLNRPAAWGTAKDIGSMQQREIGPVANIGPKKQQKMRELMGGVRLSGAAGYIETICLFFESRPMLDSSMMFK